MKSIEKLRRAVEEQNGPILCRLVRAYTGMDVRFASSADVVEAIRLAIDEIEAELEEGWVELPKDSDGIPIRPDDEIVEHYPEMEPQVSTVTALILTDRWDFEQSCHETDSRDVNNLSDFYENVKHVKPDTWERIIEDATKLGYTDPDNERLTQKLVERCKELAKEERDDGRIE